MNFSKENLESSKTARARLKNIISGLVSLESKDSKKSKNVNDKYLKKLRGEVYWTETNQGEKTRMLDFDGMRERLYNLLAEKFK